MEIGRITGATRNLGAPANWDPATDGHCGGLPIRDAPHRPGVKTHEKTRSGEPGGREAAPPPDPITGWRGV